MQGVVTGTQPGDSVKVWFTGGRPDERLVHLRREGRVDEPRARRWPRRTTPALSPVYKSNPRPAYLSYYLDALAANGIGADVYDVDANGREAPSALGVLSHYNAVIWYTGDDVITREPGHGAGHRVAPRERRDARRPRRTSTRAAGCSTPASTRGCEYAQRVRVQPRDERAVRPGQRAARRLPAALSDDFLQYYLGAYIYNEDAGTTPNGDAVRRDGRRRPVQPALGWSFGSPSANNQDHTASFITTSGILPTAQFPQFDSWAAAKYDAARRAVRPAHRHVLRVLAASPTSATSA